MIDLSKEHIPWKWVCKILACMVCLCFMHISLYAQISTYEDQLVLLLEERGISQEEFNEVLIDAGYDPNNLDNLSVGETEDIGRLLQDYYRSRFYNIQQQIPQDTFVTGLSDTIDIDSILLNEDSLGLVLDTIPEVIYGHSYFRSGQIALIPLGQGYNPPETYILGAGDEVVVSIYGNSSVEESHVIGDDGSVRIYDGRVKVTIGGASKQEARIRLERRYREFFRFSPNQFSLTVTAVRPIRIQVFGEVVSPGDMTVSAANGITQVIAEAGGITDDGSAKDLINMN